MTTKTTPMTPLARVEAAYRAAEGKWRGMSWDSEIQEGRSWIPYDGSPESQAHHAEVREVADDADAFGERGYARELPLPLRERIAQLEAEEACFVEERAAEAEERGAAALDAAEAGYWGVAIREARRAAEVEGEFGDCPVWGPFAEAVEAAAVEVRDAIDSEL